MILKSLKLILKKLQKEFVEEKGKTVNLKRKNDFLENELKEMDLKIQKINSDHKKEIEEIKQNFQKLTEENKQSKTENNEKINYLEEKIKKTNDLFEKKFGDLIKLNNLTEFIKIKNKWSEIEYICKCCSNKCNKNKPNGINGNGYGNIINGENIKYINCLEGGKNFNVYAENSFNKPQHCFNYLLYYFEIKCNFEEELNNDEKYMSIGLKNSSTHKSIRFSAKNDRVFNEKNEPFKLDNTSWNSNDIFGCGLVCPQSNKLDEYPYVFFIQNGKQIGNYRKFSIRMAVSNRMAPFS
uniref:Uncharacterized protein n=1 Tax=Meloidogyne enterolobii TaxID=390850 RepID=A0A6V7W8L4_MELEN|nr:unnamed protein product [Meloidogyne enterolobii]